MAEEGRARYAQVKVLHGLGGVYLPKRVGFYRISLGGLLFLKAWVGGKQGVLTYYLPKGGLDGKEVEGLRPWARGTLGIYVEVEAREEILEASGERALGVHLFVGTWGDFLANETDRVSLAEGIAAFTQVLFREAQVGRLRLWQEG